MFEFQYIHILIIMAGAIFTLGAIILVIGILIVAKNAFGKEIKALASATSKLAQKGLSQDIAGLVGNASSLMSEIQKMASTAAGTGFLMIITGSLFMTGAVFIFLNLDKFPTYIL